jgi:hypothetical protein
MRTRIKAVEAMTYAGGREVAVRAGAHRRARAVELFAQLRAARPPLADGFDVHVTIDTGPHAWESLARIRVDERVNQLIVVALGGQGLRGLDNQSCRLSCHDCEHALSRAHSDCGPDMRAMAGQLGLPDAAYSTALTALLFVARATRRFPLGVVAVVDVSGAG